MKVNPVTGKMEKVDPASAADGKHTDGSLRLDNRYVNAAKELGLGGADGMYSHIKSLGAAADIPHGTSIESAASERARADAPRPTASVDVRNTDAAMAAIRTTVTTVGRAKIAGFSSGVRSSSAHNHEDAFQRRKGVVNTVSGAKDVTRASLAEPARLPPKGGAHAGPRIMSMDTLETMGAEGRLRAEGREKRDRAAAKMAAGAGGQHDLGGNPVSSSRKPASAPHGSSARGGGGVAMGSSSVRKPAAAASSAASSSGYHASSAGPSHVLGGAKPPLGGAGGPAGGGGGAAGATAAAIAERRAAHFEAKFAEEKAKKAAATKIFMERD